MAKWLSFPEALQQAQVYTIRLPKGTVWRPEVASMFMQRILALGRTIFQIVADDRSTRWQILDVRETSDDAELVQAAVKAEYPEAEVDVEPHFEPAFTSRLHRGLFLYKQINPFFAPIKYVYDLKSYDPLVSLTNLMSDLLPGERISYLVHVVGEAPQARKEAERIMKFDLLAGFVLTVIDSIGKPGGSWIEDKYDPAIKKVFEEKLSYLLYRTYVLVQIDTQTRERITHFASGFASSFAGMAAAYQLEVPQWLTPHDQKGFIDDVHSQAKALETGALELITRWALGTNSLYQDVRCIFNSRELATLWHLPHEGFSAPTIDWTAGKRVPLPIELRGVPAGVRLGDNLYAGQSQPVYIPTKDRIGHMVVVGKTRTGKTSFLHNLIHQDIRAGRGVAVVDPQGKLVSDVLQNSITHERERDVVVLDIFKPVLLSRENQTPARVFYPPPLNLLARPASIRGKSAAGQLVAILEKIYGDFSTRLMADTLSNALTLLAVEPAATLFDVRRVFEDTSFRDQLLRKHDDFELAHVWDDYAKMRDAERRNLLMPILRRLRLFTRNEHLRTISCHPDHLSFTTLLAQNKIILVSLDADEAVIPETERNVLGAALISQIQMAAMAGAVSDLENPYFLYVDEAQNFVTTAMDVMLSQAAKKGLSVTLANQYFRQLEGDLRDAVEGTVNAIVSFEVGDPDARALAAYLRPNFDAADLVNLGQFRAVTSIRVNQRRQPAFNFDTFPPPQPDNTPEALAEARLREQHIRWLSVQQYTPKPFSEVENWLQNRYHPSALPQETEDDLFSDPL